MPPALSAAGVTLFFPHCPRVFTQHMSLTQQSPHSCTGPSGGEQRLASSQGGEPERSPGEPGLSAALPETHEDGPRLRAEAALVGSHSCQRLEGQDYRVLGGARAMLSLLPTVLDETHQALGQPDRFAFLLCRTGLPVLLGPASGPISRVTAQPLGPELPPYLPSESRTPVQLISQPPTLLSYFCYLPLFTIPHFDLSPLACTCRPDVGHVEVFPRTLAWAGGHMSHGGTCTVCVSVCSMPSLPS